jgi:preprotein translocase subunit SecE
MSSKPETRMSRLDTAKLAFAVLLLAVAIIAFYLFADYSALVRVVGLLIAAGISVGVIATTELGASLLGFFQDSRGELRKVVWPTRQETLQVSLAVIAMVLIMGIFLWLLDMFLFWLVRVLTG